MLYNYLVRLTSNGIRVIPVRGYGTTSAQAKIPLIPKGLKYKEYKDEHQQQLIDEVTRKTIDLVAQGKIFAFGVPGSFNRIIWIDIDAKKFPVDSFHHVFRELARKGAYVERTANNGIHIGVRARDDEQLNVAILPKVGEIDNKTFGYVIAYPSILVTDRPRQVLRYIKFEESKHLYEDIAYLDEVIDLLEEFVSISSPETLAESTEYTTESSSRNIPTISIGRHIPPKREAILALLKLAMEAIECEGYYKLFDTIEKGRWIVPYVEYSSLEALSKHSRSSWGIVEYNIGVLMRILGFNRNHIDVLADWIDLLQSKYCYDNNGVFECGDPANTPPHKAMEQGWKYNYWGLDLRESCILKMLGICKKQDCLHNVVTLTISRFNNIISKLVELAIRKN